MRLKHPSSLADSMTWDGHGQQMMLNSGGPGVLLGNLLTNNPSAMEINSFNGLIPGSGKLLAVNAFRNYEVCL